MYTWTLLDYGNIHYVQWAWVTAILVLSFILRDLLVRPIADRAHPSTGPVVEPLPACDAPTVELPGVRKAHEALDHRCLRYLEDFIVAASGADCPGSCRPGQAGRR